MAYFIHLRMRLARLLRDQSRKPIKVVAIETGYKDPCYFSRAFKKAMGISPELYRETKTGQAPSWREKRPGFPLDIPDSY